MKVNWITTLVVSIGGSAIFFLSGCGDSPNNPYPNQTRNTNTIFTAFTERPKHLDPAISYSSDEALITYQVYEPPLQYAYLTRPYTLVPLTATEMPSVRFEEENGQLVSIYTISIKPGIFYQPHPAFAKNPKTGEFLYHTLPNNADYRSIQDFSVTDTRELVAEDYVFEIKRLADPSVNSPIFGVMMEYIVGLNALSKTLRETKDPVDLRVIPLEGVKALDKYHYEIKIHGKYPQFMYWLTMPFFAPMPWEAIAFYDQNCLKKNNVILDWFPVGTGPFLLQENNPNLRMILSKNPNFHGEKFPEFGTAEDKEAGLLEKAGKPLPLLDKIVFTREKESIPYWTKFLQGYYDQAGITADNFDQALNVSGAGNLGLSESVKSKGIRLSETVTPSFFYWGFNMQDEILGGYAENKRKLRQAISIAFDVEQYISIFLNGGGVPLHGPLVPGLFGYEDDQQLYNPYVYRLNENQQVVRRSLKEARNLLKEAGYPNGVDPKTQKPLIIYLDIAASGNPDAQAQVGWYRNQLKKIGINLVIRATQYSRFQDKMSNGDFQMFFFGWSADYPDPENFLFLLISKNSRAKYDGQNVSNYSNVNYDNLFEKMKILPNSKERSEVIQEMVKILQKDSPLIWGFTPTSYVLRQQWVDPFKINAMSRSTYKYMSVNAPLRDHFRLEWNYPIRWPLIVGILLLGLLCIPAFFYYWKKMHQPLHLYLDKRKKYLENMSK